MQVSAVMLKTISGVAAASRRLAEADHLRPNVAERADHHSNGSSPSHSGALFARCLPFVISILPSYIHSVLGINRGQQKQCCHPNFSNQLTIVTRKYTGVFFLLQGG